MFPWYSLNPSRSLLPSLWILRLHLQLKQTNKKTKKYIYIHTHPQLSFVNETSIKLEKGKKKKHTQNFLVLLCFSASIASFDPVFHNRSVQSTRYQQVSGLTKSIQDYVVLFYWEDDLHYRTQSEDYFPPPPFKLHIKAFPLRKFWLKGNILNMWHSLSLTHTHTLTVISGFRMKAYKSVRKGSNINL